MAIRFARQAGNWSDPLTWDDGLTIPTTGDEVYLNNYNITIDQDITTGFIANSITPIGVPLDPIPDMTSNTSPVGVGQAFATQNSVTAWKAFRKGLNTVRLTSDGWIGTTMTGQLGFQFDTSKIIKRYSWYNNQSAGNRPKSWTFEGSNDGVTWVVLDTIVNATSVANYYSSVLANTTSYTYYRINVTATQGPTSSCIINSLNMTESTSFGNGYLSGGTATISTSRTINADLYSGAQTTFITVSATAPSIVNITGNLPGTKVVNFSRAMTVSGNCTLNFVGNIVSTAASVGVRQDVKGIVLTASATLNVTGDVYGGTNTQTGTTSSENIGIWSSNGATINVVGNVDGGTGARNRGITMVSNDTLNVTGNVTGGIGSSTTVPVQGILLGSSTIPCTIVGTVSSGINSYGVVSGTTPVRITGNLINDSSGRIAVSVIFLFLESTNMSWEFRKSDLTTNTLYTPGVATGHPAEANVRTGITYGPTNNLTGTCAVPPAGAVSLGVPVDNTTGTAYLSGNDISNAVWDTQTTNLTTAGSIGERLKDASTVDTTAATVAAYDI